MPNELLKKLIESAPEMAMLLLNQEHAVLVLDERGHLLLYNRSAVVLFGHKHMIEELVQSEQQADSLWRLEDLNGIPLPSARWPMAMARKGCIVREAVCRVLRADTGRSFIGSFSTIVHRDPVTKQRLAIVTCRDITTLRRLEQEREKYLADLSTLIQVSRQIVAERNPQAIAQKAADAVRRLVDARIVVVEQGHEDEDFCFRAYGTAEARRLAEGLLRAPLRRLYARLLFSPALRLTQAGLAAEPAWWGTPAGPEPLRGLLAVRLEDGDGKADGWIVVSDKADGGEFGERDQSLLSQLASITALALQQAEAQVRIVEQRDQLQELAASLQGLNQTLEQQVRERTRLAEDRARRLLDLAVQLAEAEERERDRIAQLLHEDLQQMLAAARLLLQNLERDLQGQRVPPAKLVHRVDALLQESIARARYLSYELSPPVLHQAGLLGALQYLARHLQEQHGLETVIEAGRWREIKDNALRTMLYRAVQELLFNVVKHAQTRRAVVRLDRTEDRVEVTVSDSGQGFDLARLSSSGGGAAGFGLLSIRERIQALGGTFDLESAPGTGSRFHIRLPASLTVEATAPEPAPAGGPVPNPPGQPSVRGGPKPAAAGC